MERMREVLRSSLRRSLSTWSDEDRLAAAWPVACGPALASHAQPQSVDAEGILHILVDGAEWMEPFLRMRSVLSSDLSRIAGVRLAGIHFQSRQPSRERGLNIGAAARPNADALAQKKPNRRETTK